MSRLAIGFVAAWAVFVCLSGAAGAQTPRPGCTSDGSLEVCVTSAALVGQRGIRNVSVSATLRIRNLTEYPLEAALHDQGWGSFAFTPQNAEAIPNEGSWRATGLQICDRDRGCEYTTIASRSSAILQISYPTNIDESGWPLAQAAQTASFATSLLVRERGAPRIISVALEGFSFGNALGNVRR